MRFSHVAAGCCAALTAGFVVTPPVEAAVLMTDPGTANLRNNGTSNYPGSIGYSFTVDVSNFVVTALGAYDAPGTAASPSSGSVGDGMEADAAVYLYEHAETPLLIASSTVPAGTTGTLVDAFRYVDLDSSVALTEGKTYRLYMTVTSGGNGFLNRSASGNATFSSDVTYGQEWYGSGYPTSSSGWDPFVGPNLQYIPEPTSVAVLGLSGLLLMGRRRRSMD